MAEAKVSTIVKAEKVGFVPKVKKNLTPPVLKLEEDTPVYVQITAPMYVGKVIKAKAGEKEREPAHILDCVNLETGEVCQVIASSIIQSTLTEGYPNNGYVGLRFSFTKKGKQPGKQYNKFEILELE